MLPTLKVKQLVQEEPVKFKVGDKVTVIGNRKERGQTGEVRAVVESPSGHNFIVFFPDDSNDFKEDQLEKT